MNLHEQADTDAGWQNKMGGALVLANSQELMEFMSQNNGMVKGPREIGNEEQGKTSRKRRR